MEIAGKLREIIAEALNLKIKPDKIMGKNLIEELGISSVDALEILIRVESEFEILINDEDLSQELVTSLTNLERYINGQLELAS
jgi:acyl carrier protein